MHKTHIRTYVRILLEKPHLIQVFILNHHGDYLVTVVLCCISINSQYVSVL